MHTKTGPVYYTFKKIKKNSDGIQSARNADLSFL